MNLILASKSPYRRALMENAGLLFQAVTSPFDEDEFKEKNHRLNPKDLCLKLAEEKARALANTRPESSYIIGSDQLIEIDHQALDKPHSYDKALSQLKMLSGRTHQVHTSLALMAPDGRMFSTLRTIYVKMKNLTDSEIERYIKLDNPLDCAGSYKMEKAGLLLAESVESADPSAIQGFSLIDLHVALRHFGKSPLDFWKGPG